MASDTPTLQGPLLRVTVYGGHVVTRPLRRRIEARDLGSAHALKGQACRKRPPEPGRQPAMKGVTGDVALPITEPVV